MKANISSWDRVIRVVLGIVLIVLMLTNVIPGILGTILAIVGAVFILTAAINWCPIYALLKISTK